MTAFSYEMGLHFKPIWFDSLGAKSACTLVTTDDLSILLEPGIAVMHDSFPASSSKKQAWYDEGYEHIRQTIKKADMLICSHYHYDHYIDDDLELYKNKTLLLKNPNEFINDAQLKRAKKFIGGLSDHYQITGDEVKPSTTMFVDYGDPLENIPLARNMDYGSYNTRKKQLLKKGKKWFDNRVQKWDRHQSLSEMASKEITILFAENKEMMIGETLIRCSKPMFHGIEFARVGWVFATIIEHRGKKFMHTSDICGPMIEDYAAFIIQENPDILVLDGPPAYMYGYMLAAVNLKRAIDNGIHILRNIDANPIIYDHHLTRDPYYMERTKPVWDAAEEFEKPLVTAAEYLGQNPVVLNQR